MSQFIPESVKFPNFLRHHLRVEQLMANAKKMFRDRAAFGPGEKRKPPTSKRPELAWNRELPGTHLYFLIEGDGLPVLDHPSGVARGQYTAALLRGGK